MSAKIKRLRRVEITKGAEVDYFFKSLPAVKSEISSPDQVITFFRLLLYDHFGRVGIFESIVIYIVNGRCRVCFRPQILWFSNESVPYSA